MLNLKFTEVFIQFDKSAAEDRSSLGQDALLDWESRRSDALLKLRKKHLQVNITIAPKITD